MGIKTRHIIWHVMVREARSSIILGLTIATISLIGATAMAGLVGAGGLGDLAYRSFTLRTLRYVCNGRYLDYTRARSPIAWKCLVAAKLKKD